MTSVRYQLNEAIRKLESTPIRDFKFGHTPIQIEYFQTSNQQGDERWEYWQHLLQMKALYSSLCEMRITYDETQYEINDAMSLWPFWSYKKRRRSLARLRFKLDTIQRSIEEKTREVQYHLTVIDRKYSHLKKMTEDEIISSEGSYWAMRLGRQLGASHMSRIMGVSESELLAVLALPKEQQQQIFSGMRMLLTDVNKMLPSQQKREDQSDDK